MKKQILILTCTLILPWLAMPAAAQDQADPVAAQVEAITAPLVGRVGFAAQLIGSDKIISHNGDMNFPMASTYKVPAAVSLLKKVEAGEYTLGHMVELPLDDMATGDNVIAQNFVHPGLQLSVANLIEAMITMSDNTATDAVFSLAGGPEAITAAMRKLGIEDMRIDRNTKDLIMDMAGMDGPATVAAVEKFLQSNPEKVQQFVTMPKDPKFEADPRDQSTPFAMLDLLMKIDDATAINKDSRDFLIASMSRTRTGAGRIKGLLPRGTPVAHKTGTSIGVANDVGYVTLPDGRRFAIVIFTASSDTPLADRDRAVAEVARTLYDYFATSSSNEGADDKEITVKLTVPDLTWTVSIDEIRKVDDELWVISSVSQNPDVMGAQVISMVQASVKVAVPDLPVKYFITGKTWDWVNTEPYTFITDLKQIENDITSGESLYPTAQRSTIPELVLNKTWQWESTITPVKKINVPNPEGYTILLTDEGRIQARFDCNRGGGSYEISAGKLSFGPLTSTRMACPEDSLDAPFMRDLQRVVSFFVEDGHLYLELPYDSGTMKFRSAP